MASGSGRSQPQTPTSQQNFAPGFPQTQGQATAISQVAQVPATSTAPEEGTKAKSQQALISLVVSTPKLNLTSITDVKAPTKSAEDQVVKTTDGGEAAVDLGNISAQQASQQVKLMQPGAEGASEKVVVATSGSVIVRGPSTNTAAAPFDDRQQPNHPYGQSSGAQDDNAAKRQRQGTGQEHFRLTASNLDKHEQLLISQRGSGSQQQPSRQSMVINGVQVSNVGGGGGSMTQKSQGSAQVVVPQTEQPSSTVTNPATSGLQGQVPSITIQTANPGPGRPVGSNNAARKQKAQQQAAAAAAAQAQAQAQAQQQQQQLAQIQQQQSTSQPVPQIQPIMPNASGDPAAHQAAILSQQQQQQKLLMQMKAQQAQAQQRNFSSDYIAYQQQQQRQLQHQNSSSSMQGQPHTQAQQEALLRHQQALAAQQASQGHGGHPGTQQQQQQAYQMQQQQQLNGEQSQKFFAQFVNRRVHQCFQDKLTCLQQTDKQNNDTMAKQIKKEETAFFLKNDDSKYQKISLLENKNQRMDEYISLMAENGGRVIPKQPEPISAPRETPMIVEMRYQHMEMVEEAYWKRVMAARLAHQCQVVAIRKAKERVQRAQQEQIQAQENERLEELRRREEEQKAAAPIQTQLEVTEDQPMQDTVAKNQLIDTTQGGQIGGVGVANDGGLEGEQDFMSQQNFFGGDLLDHSFEDPMRDPVDENYDLDVLSMRAGEDDIMQQDDMMGDQGVHNSNVVSGFPADEPDQHYDENFDPEQEIRRQEEILEQQRIEESKKQELEKLRKIDEIEKMSADGESSKKLGAVELQKRRVLENLLEESDADSDREDQLAALEEELMNIDLTYLRPSQAETESGKKDRNFKQVTDLERNAPDQLSKAADEEMSGSAEVPTPVVTAPQTAFNKGLIDCAQSAMKQQLDKLAQMILDNKDQSASELIHDSQFSQALDSIVKTGGNQGVSGSSHDNLLDQVQSMLQSEKKIDLYLMPGVDAFDFDSGDEALDLYQDGDNDSGNESSLNADIDHFFTDIKMVEKKDQKPINSTQKKLKPPPVMGHEQQRMYEELKEISQLAPERSDLAHMEHLCQFWIEREKDEIEEKRNVIKYFEKNLQEDDQRSEHNMDQKQRSVLRHNIQQHNEFIEKRKNMIERFIQPTYSAKALHKDRFMLSGQEQPVVQQPSLAPQEFSFIKWYYGLFPDQWRLIADIVNYHPLTRGPLHSKEFMAREYFQRLDQHHRDLLVGRQKIQMQPWRETGLPWLINGRQGCLMNSLTYINKSHLQSIHRMNRLTKRKRATKKVYTFILNQQGCLELVVQRQPATGVDQDVPNQMATTAPAKAESESIAGAKRVRGELPDTDGESHHSSGQDSESDIVDRLLEQMLARRRKTEREESEAAEKGTLVKNDIYSDRPFLKELMLDISYKRRKLDEQSSAQNLPTFVALAYDPKQVTKDELNTKTPMWYALQNQLNCQMTIRVQHSTMFWLGYFIRRIMHEDNLYKLKMSQQFNMQTWEAQNEIKNYFINQAKKIRIEAKQQGYQHRLVTEKQNQDNLQKEIQHFLRAQASSPQTRADAISFVNDLWDGKSPYQYDKEQRAEYIKQEKDNQERISNVMSQKSKHLWEELQFYWFQVNKNLHPRYRKVEHNQPGQSSSVGVDPSTRAPYGQYPGQGPPGSQQVRQMSGLGGAPIDPATAQARYLAEQQQKAQQMAAIPGHASQQSQQDPLRKQLSIVDANSAEEVVSNNFNRSSMMMQQASHQQRQSQGQLVQGGMPPGVVQSQQQFNMQNISAMNSSGIGAISASQSGGVPGSSSQQAYQGPIRGVQGPQSQPIPSSQQQRRQQTGQIPPSQSSQPLQSHSSLTSFTGAAQAVEGSDFQMQGSSSQTLAPRGGADVPSGQNVNVPSIVGSFTGGVPNNGGGNGNQQQ